MEINLCRSQLHIGASSSYQLRHLLHPYEPAAVCVCACAWTTHTLDAAVCVCVCDTHIGCSGGHVVGARRRLSAAPPPLHLPPATCLPRLSEEEVTCSKEVTCFHGVIRHLLSPEAESMFPRSIKSNNVRFRTNEECATHSINHQMVAQRPFCM